MTTHPIPLLGVWRPGRASSCVVSDVAPLDGHGSADEIKFYGGYLIAESIPPSVVPVIAAAPRLLRALELMVAWHGRRGDIGGDDVVLPPEYQSREVQEAMAAIRAATTYPMQPETP